MFRVYYDRENAIKWGKNVVSVISTKVGVGRWYYKLEGWISEKAGPFPDIRSQHWSYLHSPQLRSAAELKKCSEDFRQCWLWIRDHLHQLPLFQPRDFKWSYPFIKVGYINGLTGLFKD